MTPDQISLVQRSFARFSANREAVGALFYARLIEIAPELRPFFKTDLWTQGQRLMGAVALAVDHLENPEVLIGPLQEMGSRHKGYGVTDAHYKTVADALLWTLEQALGEKFDTETRDAWIALYTTVTGVMRSTAFPVAA